MLRVHFLQHWFNLFDSAAEAGLYDSRSMRRFVSIDLGHERVPDETIICKFRNFIEANNLGQQLFKLIQKYLGENGTKVHRGKMVDTTIISASRYTKKSQDKRDPEMRQTRKGNQWYFGMKTHVGVDSRTKLIHSMVATSANVHNSQVLSKLLHGKKTQVYGDSTYMEQREVIRDRKSTRLNSSHVAISYAVFCLKQKTHAKRT